MIALVDGDVMCYRIAFSCKDDSESQAITTMANFLENILMTQLGLENWEVFLTGKTNFRKDIAVTAPYKGNRIQEKPAHLEMLRNYLVTAWGAKMSIDEEADDLIAIRATELQDDCIIVSVDKDFNQVAGWHYNFVKQDKYYVSEEQGLRFFSQANVDRRQSRQHCGYQGSGGCESNQDACQSQDRKRDACRLLGGSGRRTS